MSNTKSYDRDYLPDSVIQDVENTFSSGFSTEFEHVEVPEEDGVNASIAPSVMLPIENHEPSAELCAAIADFFGVEVSQ